MYCYLGIPVLPKASYSSLWRRYDSLSCVPVIGRHYPQVAPIAVYTSGKGSSAAGLTASVQRDAVSVSLRETHIGCC